MKKVVLLLVIFLAVTGAALFAQDASTILGVIPAATYAHPTDGSTWTFAATGITVRGKDGVCEIPASQMKGIASAAEGLTSPGFTFSFDTGLFNRTYRFNLNADGTLKRTIDRAGMPQDVVTLTRQRESR